MIEIILWRDDDADANNREPTELYKLEHYEKNLLAKAKTMKEAKYKNIVKRMEKLLKEDYLEQIKQT